MSKAPSVSREIPLSRGQVAIVDAEDYEELARYRWHVIQKGNRFYASRRENRGATYMHRHLLVPPQGMVVDHINGNPLDNRRSNLRVATQQQNMQNRRRAKDNKSGFKGVSWDSAARRWAAHIRINYIYKKLGRFDTPQDAAQAYCNAAFIYHGEFARYQ